MESSRIKSKLSLAFNSYAAVVFLAQALLAQTAWGQVHAQNTKNPLAGQWHCTTTAMRMPAFQNIPAGSMVQSVSYKADAQGRWASNSILQYRADNGEGHFRVHSAASGVHTVSGQIVTEQIQRFHITHPVDTSSAFARSAVPIFNAALTATVQSNAQQRYLLLQSTPNRYVMQPLTNSGQKTSQRIVCQKVTTP